MKLFLLAVLFLFIVPCFNDCTDTVWLLDARNQDNLVPVIQMVVVRLFEDLAQWSSFWAFPKKLDQKYTNKP